MRGILACGALVCLSACAGVQVSPAPQADSAACADLSAHWPAQVGKHEAVATRPDGPGVAAWGKPPIVARCGVRPPAPTTLECLSIDDVDWIVEPLSDGTVFTTFGRDPALEVIVPSAYAPAPLQLPAFTAAAATLPRTTLRCS
ncbi:DUF3515 domain-containing protein [Gephyromycinifex aptenodytis]|uniref:DUF3515 domain-containing protein n=1 Tax=Gephyromycinifex aptenodytis TaxID=2716227 RepID=UPI00144754CF|nr:DUF3515 domain-containing protein [Gephyromycinifex aptenodytis]